MRWHFIPDFDGDVSPVFDRRASRQEARPNRELSLSVSQGPNPSRRRLQRAWIVTAMDRVSTFLGKKYRAKTGRHIPKSGLQGPFISALSSSTYGRKPGVSRYELARLVPVKEVNLHQRQRHGDQVGPSGLSLGEHKKIPAHNRRQ